MKVFVLEDEIDSPPRMQILEILSPRHEVHVARSFKAAKRAFRPPYDLMLLDHDMEGFFEDSNHPNTGYQFVKWMVSKQVLNPRPVIILHSQNSVGRRNMKDLLTQYDLECAEFPFSSKFVQTLKDAYGV